MKPSAITLAFATLCIGALHAGEPVPDTVKSNPGDWATWLQNKDNLALGANREGNFYGVMIMPYYWMIEDKLHAVLQIEHMASSASEAQNSPAKSPPSSYRFPRSPLRNSRNGWTIRTANHRSFSMSASRTNSP